MNDKVGSFEIVPVKKQVQRLSMLIWGPAGCGKTTLASTAPGKKLLINFDPDGASSIAGRDDVDVLDLSPALGYIGKELDGGLVAKIKPVLDKYDTIIVDSLTNVSQAALNTGIQSTRNATYAKPSQASFGFRTGFTMKFMTDMLVETGARQKNIVFIAHEGSPTLNDEGIIVKITIMLGGQLPTQGPVNISEVWAMYDTGKDRRIAVRPCRNRTPMKTRMFTADTPEFVWKYDADKDQGITLESLYNQWKGNSFSKIKLPS